MATADELLSTLDTDKTLIIDKDLRIITIPSSVKNLGVESDDDVLRLKFSMPRMYGDVDLSDFSIYINYMNAKNTGDVYVVDDKTIADDTITFSWLVGRVALAYKGNVRFIVCMKKHDGDSNVIQEYNTTIASLPVLEGLETGETVIQQNPDIIEMLLTLSEPLVGTNKTLTPWQVREAFLQGRPIIFSFIDALGEVAAIFQSFELCDDIIVASSIIPLIGSQDMGVGVLTGYSSNVWDFSETLITNPDEIQKTINTALAAAKASGEFDGADGITPTIGDNGNWYLGDTDTNKPSRGETGPRGEKGADGATGATGADGKSAYSYAQDGGYLGTEKEFAEKLAQEQLTGTTSELTPAQVYDAVSSGIPVKVQYTDSTYGLLSFTAFNVAESLNVIVSQTIVYYNSMYILAELYGNKSNNTWGTAFTTLAQKTDIPSALPNPHPLTFTGAVTGSYDGSSAKTIKIPIAVDGQSAYAAAQAGGYTDTEANFYADLAAMQGLAAELAAI